MPKSIYFKPQEPIEQFQHSNKENGLLLKEEYKYFNDFVDMKFSEIGEIQMEDLLLSQ